MKKILAWGLAIAAVGVAAVFFYDFTISRGMASMEEIAAEGGYCQDSANCSQEARLLADVLLEMDTGYETTEQIYWCLGTDEWAQAEVRRGGLVRSAIVSVMSLRCPADEQS